MKSIVRNLLGLVPHNPINMKYETQKSFFFRYSTYNTKGLFIDKLLTIPTLIFYPVG